MTKDGTIPQALRAARQRKRLSQATVASRSGQSQQAVSDIEGEKYAPTPLALHSMCRALDIDVYELLRETNARWSDAEQEALDALVQSDLERELAWSSGSELQTTLRQLQYAEDRRRRGHPDEAGAEAKEVITRLTPMLQASAANKNVVATLLVAAYDTKLAAGVHACRADSGAQLRRESLDMRRLATELLPEDNEWLARADLRVADVCRAVYGKDLSMGRDAAEQCARCARSDDLRIEGQRAVAGCELRLGNIGLVTAALSRMGKLLDKADVSRLKASIFHQSIAWTLAAASGREKRAALGELAEAEHAYLAATAAGAKDVETWPMILRSGAFIAATLGPGFDLDVARSKALEGKRLAPVSGRERLVRHCDMVLQATDGGRPLAAEALRTLN